jgi:transcriptional regulator with XRE-family HTH domain
MNDRERIGRRIREVMDKRGISTYRLAELTGLHRPNIQRIISGKYSTGLDILSKIADALGCEFELTEKKKDHETDLGK